MNAGTVQIAMRALPLKLKLRRKAEFVVAAIALVDERVIFDEPLKSLDIGRRFPDLKHHEEIRAGNGKLREGGVLVIAVKTFEIREKLRVAEQIHRERMEFMLFELIYREDIRGKHFSLEPDVHVVAEDEF